MTEPQKNLPVHLRALLREEKRIPVLSQKQVEQVRLGLKTKLALVGMSAGLLADGAANVVDSLAQDAVKEAGGQVAKDLVVKELGGEVVKEAGNEFLSETAKTVVREGASAVGGATVGGATVGGTAAAAGASKLALGAGLGSAIGTKVSAVAVTVALASGTAAGIGVERAIEAKQRTEISKSYEERVVAKEVELREVVAARAAENAELRAEIERLRAEVAAPREAPVPTLEPIPEVARHEAPAPVLPPTEMVAGENTANAINANPSNSNAAPEAVGRSTLAGEQSLLERARTALSRGEYDEALGALSQHRTRFPDGSFKDERDGLRVIALLRAGRRDEAHHAAEAYLREHPTGILRGAVQGALHQGTQKQGRPNP